MAISDWKRIPGRRFLNTKTGEEISRRQFDKRYGALAAAGLTSYETKSAANRAKEGIEQLAKPARGRKKIKTQDEAERRVELERRADIEREKQIEKVEARTAKKKFRTPTKFSMKNFPKGKMGHKWRVGLDFESVTKFLDAARKFRCAVGYMVALEFINENGKKGASTIFPLRPMGDEFTEDDFMDIIAYIMERSYIRPLNLSIYIALKKECYERHGKK